MTSLSLKRVAFLAVVCLATTHVSAQSIEITGTGAGRLTWNASSVSVANVEWNWDLNNPDGWSRSWESLRSISPTGSTMTTQIPMYYRITGTPDGDAILTDAKKAQIQTMANSALSNYAIPGISYAIKFFGEPVYKNAVGIKNTDGWLPLTPDDHMRIGSASKTFISMGTMKLVHDGVINLDQPITDYYPTVTNILSNYTMDVITARMLIQHTAGIRSYTDLINDWNIPYIYDRTRVWTDTELLSLVNVAATNTTGELLEPITPGRIWQYSNSHYVLLGMIIEHVTGTDIATFVENTFLTPLGLTETHYPRPGESIPPTPYSSGYMNWSNFFGESFLPGWQDVTEYDPTGVGPAGPMISTASDLTKWTEAVITDQIGLGPDYNPDIYNWKIFLGRLFGGTNWNYATTYGLGLAHEGDKQNSANYFIVGHRGQIGGYDTGMMVLPDKRVSIVVMCNRSLWNAEGYPSNALEALLNNVVAVLYPDMIAANQTTPYSAEESAAPASSSSPPSVATSSKIINIGGWTTQSSGEVNSDWRGNRILSEY